MAADTADTGNSSTVSFCGPRRGEEKHGARAIRRRMKQLADPSVVPLYELRCKNRVNTLEPVSDLYSSVTHIRTIPDDIIAFHLQFPQRAIDLPCETAALLMLNQARRIVGACTWAAGDRQHAFLSTDAVLTRASLRSDCTGVLVGHAHLHGDPSPSPGDFDVFRALRREMPPYIELVDFCIWSGLSIYSFRFAGHFEAERAA